MEYALGVRHDSLGNVSLGVLILVLMEYALGGANIVLKNFAIRLNPCSNGICSRRS